MKNFWYKKVKVLNTELRCHQFKIIICNAELDCANIPAFI